MPRPTDQRRPTLALLACALAVGGCSAGPRPGTAGAGPVEGGRPVPAVEGAGSSPRAVLGRFATAVRAGRFEEAWPLLSARWRARTTPEQLASDWRGAGPVAREAADRVVALLAAGLALEVEGAPPAPTGGAGKSPAGSPFRGAIASQRLVVGPGRAARLIEEAQGWRVDALE